ncbi:hypothetical protein OG342_19620 [Streptomyces bobili]|uniref:hypothetical protein n=1 Tax=Streptomyces bobili TaxID=67280 RepID=UPI00224DEA18|nr:hypothetical protein [Streptomyces bobili]MCX5525049.1 hypothetical protein [Streptomyces bobili]
MEHVDGGTVPRLLPWPTPEGKPCYLVTDDSGSRLSRLADDLEARQLATGADVLVLARTVLDDHASPYAEVRYAGLRLAECLTDALRVAESRGMRLVVPEPGGADRA